MNDVFNNENESFMQETRLLENEYPINLLTRFYYKKKCPSRLICLILRKRVSGSVPREDIANAKNTSMLVMALRKS